MIIAISGKRGVGKTTAANFIQRTYGFKKVSFAGILKQQAKSIFPFTESQLAGSEKERPYFKNGETPRDFMIKYGQFIRYFDESYWIKKVFEENWKESNIVIDDLRYQDEANHLKNERGAVLLRVERYKSHNPYKGELDDPSETSLDNHSFDFRINEIENRNLQSLYTRLELIMDDLNYGRR